MTAKSRPYCSVCRHYIRGSQAVHNQTKEHRRLANPHVRVTKKAQRAARRRARPRRSQGDAYIHVVRYRRSPPYDGRRRTVRVVDHWRPLPGSREGSKAERRHRDRDAAARAQARTRELAAELDRAAASTAAYLLRERERFLAKFR